MRKQTLLLLASSSLRGYRPSIRLGKHGHPMRDPEGHAGGGNESMGGGDNGGGNAGNSGGGNGNAGTQANNGGEQFDYGSFWNSPQEETPAAAGNGGSAGGNPPAGTQQNQNQNEGNAFAQALEGLNFGSDVFTADAVEKMNNGDATAFNGNMTQFGRQVTKQATILAAQLMQRNNQNMEAKFEQMMEARFGQRDTETDLSKAIPSYGKPGMKPIIDGIMTQALKLTKGDRGKAIQMAKGMLQFQAQSLGEDFGITTPPGGAGNDFGTGQSTNWTEELLGRD